MQPEIPVETRHIGFNSSHRQASLFMPIRQHEHVHHQPPHIQRERALNCVITACKLAVIITITNKM